ncbi:GntR family transcriptional regulator [Aeoliella sp. SH292]|uniref:GntR family transcriptional regulator n=1 Tax=Aeoliella sp. SH292 TaxID=3454464 RepID=UPI003F988111
MIIRVDSQNGVPVYEQIVRQVMFAIADGVVAPGDLLPSVRELARELAINPNTVARAYRDLQSQGVVEFASGIGLAVKSGARRDCQTQRRQLLQHRIGLALEEAFLSGLDTDAIRRMVDAEITRLEKQSPNLKGSA